MADEGLLPLADLFKAWLAEEMEALKDKGSRMFKAYKRASDNLANHAQTIATPRDLKGVPYIGEKIVSMLCSRLRHHCESSSLPIPDAFQNYVGSVQGGKRSLDLEPDKPPKQRRATKWIPKRRSGGWAMLIALYKYRNRLGLSKDELVSVAAPYCDKSFTSNPGARDFFSAWSSMTTLLKHECVVTKGRPKIYEITETGIQMAQLILLQEGIEDSPIQPDTPEMSFDNGQRATPIAVDAQQLFVSEIPSSPLANKVTSQNTPFEESINSVNHDLELAVNRAVHDIENRVLRGVKYDIWLPDEFEVVLLIDTREIRSSKERYYFKEKVSSSGVKCETENLSVGDVLWVAKHKSTNQTVVLNYVCERKRLDDLALSIRDGRFTEQKSRLKNSGLKNIFYLVEEGGLDNRIVGEMRQSIETAMSTIITTSKFNLQRFKSIENTTDWLRVMTDILIQYYLKLRLIVLKPESVNTKDQYLELLNSFRAEFETENRSYECVYKFSLYQSSLTKTTMMTVKDMFIKMLMQIKGMSLEKAIVLQKHFQVPKNLIEFFLERGAGKSDLERAELIMNLFQDQIGSKKYNKSLLREVYEVWGTEA